MICLLGGTLTTSEGLLFALPEEGHAGLVEQKDLEEASLVALLLPTPQGTLVFFDDARYSLSDAAAVEAFRERLAACVQADRSGTLLLLADGRVASGDLMRLMGLAREAGVTRVQIGERRE